MTNRHSRIGSKGQVVILKELREKHGLKEGELVEQISTDKGVLLVPISVDSLSRDLEDAAERIGKAWPKGKTAVAAIREDREKQP